MHGKPDALLMPASMKKGATSQARLDYICTMAEAYLGMDRKKGQHAYVRMWPPEGAVMFVTTSELDEMYFPKHHERDGEHRYRWEMQPNGVAFGFFVDGAFDSRSEVKSPLSLERWMMDRLGVTF